MRKYRSEGVRTCWIVCTSTHQPSSDRFRSIDVTSCRLHVAFNLAITTGRRALHHIVLEVRLVIVMGEN